MVDRGDHNPAAEQGATPWWIGGGATPPAGAEVRVLWVCEAGRRWCDVARRFLGPFQHAPSVSGAAEGDDAATPMRPLIQVVPVDRRQAGQQGPGSDVAGVLWELGPESAPALAAVIGPLGRRRPQLVQVAGLQAGLPRSVARRLALRLQQLGVVAVAETPEHFAVLSELIRRHLLRPPSSAADHAQAAAGANPRAGSA